MALAPSVEKSAKKKYEELGRKKWDHASAIRAARAYAAFDYLLDEVVKLEAVPDEIMFDDSYLDDDEDAKKELWERIESDGVWIVKSLWRLDDQEDWEGVDSVGGFVGEDWDDSGYDTDLKIAALTKFANAAANALRGKSGSDAARFLVLRDFLEVARYGIAEKEVPQLPPSPVLAPAPIRIQPHLFSRHTFQIRQNMYHGGWDIIRFEQTPDRPAGFERMTSAISPKSEAISVAKSYAHDLAERMRANPNAIRVLNEYGECVHAVRATGAGAIDIPCPESIIKNPRRRRARR